MEIIVSQQQGRVPVTVFHIKGDINTETYEQFQTQTQQAVQAGTSHLLLDLAEVPYVSSYGIRALSYVFKLLSADSPSEGGAALDKGLRDGTFKSPHLKLVNPSRQVLKVLTTAGIDMFLEIHSDLKQAVASF
jgi:anti-anti-sigma factor